MSAQRSILRTLTKRSFRANRGRNLVAILAIVLTTMMFTSLFVLSQSMMENIQQMYIQQAGFSSQLSSSALTTEEADAISAHEAVRDASRSIIVGVLDDVPGRQVELRWADDAFAESALSLPTEGNMPEAADEVALDSITLDKLGVSHELGTTVHLTWITDTTSGETESRDFTLCGTWDGNAVAMASMAWVSEDFVDEVCGDVDQAALRDAGGYSGLEMLHIDLYDDSDLEGTAAQILADTGLSDTVRLSTNMAYDSAVSENMTREVLPMAICMVLVFVSGYLIIYNIFQISVAADIRFYGRLKTLGATKRQLKKIIYGQARRLALVGIPIGLVIGYLLGAVLVPMMITSTGGEARVAMHPLIFIGAAIFAYVTVRISCMKPARLAGKVSPMEALRYTDAGTQSKRKLKKSRGGASLWQMAWANLGRNKRRTVLVVASLTLGLVLLSGVYAKNASFDIDKYLSQTVISDFEVEDASISSNFTTYDPHGTTISAKLVNQIENLAGLESTGRLYAQVIQHDIGPSAMTNIENYYNADERLPVIEATDAGLYDAYNDMIASGSCTAMLYGIDGIVEDTFAEDGNVLGGTFDKDAFEDGGYVLVEAGPAEDDSETAPTYNVGDTVTLGDDTYEVMAIVRDINTVTEGVNSTTEDFLSFYIPAEDFHALYPDNTLRKFFFDVADSDQPAAEQMLLNYQAEDDPALSYTSKATLEAHYKEQTRANTVTVFAISFIIAFVGVLNFVNSMLTAILSRRREFAMMQSIGMTKRQLRRLLIFEGLDYAWITLVLSYVLSALVVGVGVRMMVAGDWTATFHFTLLPLVICTPILLLFAVLIPTLCFKNLEKHSIVERLRQED